VLLKLVITKFSSSSRAYTPSLHTLKLWLTQTDMPVFSCAFEVTH